MNKNLIYIVAVDDPGSKIQVNEYFQYSEPTWEHYCKKYNIDLIIAREHGFDVSYRAIWNKELIFDVGKGYDKIGIVDADTMIRWDAPDIFQQFSTEEFCGVNDLCDLNWLFKSISDRQFIFPDTILDLNTYLNAGVLFFGGKYREIFERLLITYIHNKPEIDKIAGGGKEQTLLNFMLKYNKVPITLLSPAWNLLSIHRKNMFTNNWQLKIDNIPHFMKYAYVWHFTGFPVEARIQLMQQTWEMVKHNYR